MSGMNSVTTPVWQPFWKVAKVRLESNRRFWIYHALKLLALYCFVPEKSIPCRSLKSSGECRKCLAAAPRASGTLASHYAPLTPVVIVPEKDLTSVLKQLEKKNIRVALLHYSSLSSDRKQPLVKQTGLFCSPDVYSHQLYASLRELDRHRADVILVEATPDTEAWKGVNDRLRRAAYNGQGILEKWLSLSHSQCSGLKNFTGNITGKVFLSDFGLIYRFSLF